MVAAEGHWHVQTHGGYHPIGVDVTAFWRPRLRDCPTTHYSADAGRALPAIPLGLIGRVGRVGEQRLAVPLALVRADAVDPRPSTHERLLVRAAVQQAQEDDALVLDAGFGLALLHEEGAERFVLRCAKNATFRRREAPVYQGRGRPPTRGALVRPLPRVYRDRLIPATPPDRVETWAEEGTVLRAEVWADLRRADAPPQSDGPTVTVIAVQDPRYREPLLLATSLAASPPVAQALYRDRWPVEQLPLAAKQMLGAARQFVSAPETCQRLPELALLAGAILSYGAATAPAIPTGFWDRRPRPTPGRLRRALTRVPFPHDFPLLARLRVKKSPTAHLPTGFWGQRGRRVPPEEVAA